MDVSYSAAPEASSRQSCALSLAKFLSAFSRSTSKNGTASSKASLIDSIDTASFLNGGDRRLGTNIFDYTHSINNGSESSMSDGAYSHVSERP